MDRTCGLKSGYFYFFFRLVPEMVSRPHMTKVHSKNTSPEVKLRKLLCGLGYRGYRLYYAKLQGKPDIVFPRRKKVIFIHGCFWHGHDCKAGRNTPKTNLEYWVPKLERNKKRDQNNILEIKKEGWDVLVLWGCELTKKNEKNIVKCLNDFLCVSSI